MIAWVVGLVTLQKEPQGLEGAVHYMRASAHDSVQRCSRQTSQRSLFC
jgi:hypothetical protein